MVNATSGSLSRLGHGEEGPVPHGLRRMSLREEAKSPK